MERTVKIRKGRHYACGLPSFLEGMEFVPKQAVFTRRRCIEFDESCKYTLDDGNQLAWSKLTGFCLGVFGIHRDSFRFGWRYNPETEEIEIAALIYNGGRTIRERLCSVKTGLEYFYTITYDGVESIVDFKVSRIATIGSAAYSIETPKPRIKFGCGFYFGGRSKAPNDMAITVIE